MLETLTHNNGHDLLSKGQMDSPPAPASNKWAALNGKYPQNSAPTLNFIFHGTTYHEENKLDPKSDKVNHLFEELKTQLSSLDSPFYILNGVGAPSIAENSKNPIAGSYIYDPRTGTKRPYFNDSFRQAILVKLCKTAGTFAGFGTDDTLIEALLNLRLLEIEDKLPETLNLYGFSRGADAAIRFANILSKVYPYIKVNIFSVDPISGPGRRDDHEAYVVNSNVKEITSIYALDENRPGFEPQDTQQLTFTAATETVHNVNYYRGNHSSPVSPTDQTEHQATYHLTLNDMTQFVDRHVKKKSDSNASEDSSSYQEIAYQRLKRYEQMWSERQQYDNMRKGLFSDRLITKQYRADSRVWPYFVNLEHRRLFKAYFPDVFKNGKVMPELARKEPTYSERLKQARNIKQRKERTNAYDAFTVLEQSLVSASKHFTFDGTFQEDNSKVQRVITDIMAKLQRTKADLKLEVTKAKYINGNEKSKEEIKSIKINLKQKATEEMYLYLIQKCYLLKKQKIKHDFVSILEGIANHIPSAMLAAIIIKKINSHMQNLINIIDLVDTVLVKPYLDGLHNAKLAINETLSSVHNEAVRHKLIGDIINSVCLNIEKFKKQSLNNPKNNNQKQIKKTCNSFAAQIRPINTVITSHLEYKTKLIKLLNNFISGCKIKRFISRLIEISGIKTERKLLKILQLQATELIRKLKMTDEKTGLDKIMQELRDSLHKIQKLRMLYSKDNKITQDLQETYNLRGKTDLEKLIEHQLLALSTISHRTNDLQNMGSKFVSNQALDFKQVA